MKRLGTFLWFGLAVGIAGIIFIPLMKIFGAGIANKVGAKGAAAYINAA